MLTHEMIVDNFDEENKDPEVFIQTYLDSIYLEFSIQISKNIDTSENKEDRFKDMIQFIVWSALCVEALLNKVISKKLTGVSRRDRKGNAIWSSIRYTKTIDKLKLAFELLDIEEKHHKNCLSYVDKLFKLRNRLVHFKEKPTPVSTDWVVSKRSDNILEDLIKTLGETNIVTTLLELDINEYLKNLESINLIFNQVNIFDNSNNAISK